MDSAVLYELSTGCVLYPFFVINFNIYATGAGEAAAAVSRLT